MTDVLLSVEDLRVTYPERRGSGERRAVDGVSFELRRGEALGLVGESGCGKTTLGSAIVKLLRPSAGRVCYDGQDTARLRSEALRQFRRHVQMIFQDPFGSLNPRMPVGACIAEVLRVHGLASRGEVRGRVDELLRSVGLGPEQAARYPHEFSGGQRQRIGIARALALRPELIVADEPVSALDVSVRVQILNLMKDLRSAMGLSYLFIAHDLAIVRYMCERVMVMYQGKIVESGPSESLLSEPAHPYTRALLDSVPDIDRWLREPERTWASGRRTAGGSQPDAAAGCPYGVRCGLANERCRREAPAASQIAKGHWCACHFPHPR